MCAEELEKEVVKWARRQSNVLALVQIGSRVQLGGEVDAWSDWDYQLICSDTARLAHLNWPREIAPCWNVHMERTERGVDKISVVFAGGKEMDFVLLAASQVKVVCWAMARPALNRFLPAKVLRSIATLRLVLRPGFRVVLGGAAWEKRLEAVRFEVSHITHPATEFGFHVSGFWRHAVWVFKKIARGECRAAIRWNHVEVMEHLLAVLAEEARLAGRHPRPEARKAEQWLDARRIDQTAFVTAPDRKILARSLLAEISVFEEASGVVAQARGFRLSDHTALAAWLRTELEKIANPS